MNRIFVNCITIIAISTCIHTAVALRLRRSLAGIVGIVISNIGVTPHGFNMIPLPPAEAMIAPLADVGLREYLVKDGRQFLRLTMPTGPDMKMGSASIGDEGREAQEYLEIIKLRFEQVGFTNPAAWAGTMNAYSD
jgi:hypothetical protein